VSEYAIFLHWLAQRQRPWKKRNLAKRYPRGWGWYQTFKYTHSSEKARDTNLDN